MTICVGVNADLSLGLKETITSEGVWRIRKREKIPLLEVIKHEESGTGDILSSTFLQWRTEEMPQMLATTEAATQANENAPPDQATTLDNANGSRRPPFVGLGSENGTVPFPAPPPAGALPIVLTDEPVVKDSEPP